MRTRSSSASALQDSAMMRKQAEQNIWLEEQWHVHKEHNEHGTPPPLQPRLPA
jgi:hypothetical protein